MKFKVKKLLELLDEVSQKTGKSLAYADLLELTAEINAEVIEGRLKGVVIGARYIYEYTYRPTLKKEVGKYLNLNKSYVDTIARYAGYADFKDFETTGSRKEKVETKDKILKYCGGVWKSYVRTNSGRSELLIAPLHIFEEEGLTVIHMKGEKDIIYRSQLTLKGGCLRCLLDASGEDDRQVYMVLNLGVAKNPKVLMGVFAAMSSAGIPIAGREVWVREEEGVDFNGLTHQRLNMEKEADKVHENILHYFKDKGKNCWKGTPPSSFDNWDLKNE